jgi:hypothetical protein
MQVRVTNLDSFRWWKDEPDLGLDWILGRLRGEQEPSEKMLAGTAVHAALETITEGEIDTIESQGFRFDFVKDVELSLMPGRELLLSKHYGELLVTGHVDAINGLVIRDYKTTEQFDPERLMNGYQWRFYLDMAQATWFRWEVFVIEEIEPKHYWVKEHHTLDQRRYPELGSDCKKVAAEYTEFAKQYLYELAPQLEALGQ